MELTREQLILKAKDKLIKRNGLNKEESNALGLPMGRGWRQKINSKDFWDDKTSEQIYKYWKAKVNKSLKNKNRKKKVYGVSNKRKKEYHAYLKSDQWKMMRLGLLLMRGNKCEVCGELDSLQVHHKHYRNIFKEKLEDLMVVCSSCHQEIHGINS